ncbi:hypothetical protein [Oenococcus oeni]|uniref:hypothetical protein n=2 Tax=Oenococcus oeni TaxID=1247 RepID=UPI0008F8F7F9|nr:hypothetical protein [Oenococcus oeni]OIK85943.1 hypothetical protein ATW79_07255 [Oenococcus oeni]OIL08404.1 hypothetical protein ATW92_07185 [Oenococcus oeni]OIL12420.1 hypothetical protein ATW93_07320 [Oenococcus oeni]SYW05763.1 conserved hypothetical protein [Oenococcus oeni]SYW11397.1 conserved hypothetical protein [Oenococcus oeni]
MSLNLGAGDLTKATKSNYDLVVEKTSILVQFKEAAYTGEGNNNLLILKTSFSNLSFDDKIIDGIEILIGKISKKQEAKFSGIKTAAYEALIDFGEEKKKASILPLVVKARESKTVFLIFERANGLDEWPRKANHYHFLVSIDYKKYKKVYLELQEDPISLKEFKSREGLVI